MTEKMGERMEVAKAVLELLNEKHKSNVVLKRISHSTRGMARFRQQYFSLPDYLFSGYPEQYIIYYTIHEYTHCLLMTGAHNPFFKNKESELLKEFGIEIEYARAYPKRLYANGGIVYDRANKIIGGEGK